MFGRHTPFGNSTGLISLILKDGIEMGRVKSSAGKTRGGDWGDSWFVVDDSIETSSMRINKFTNNSLKIVNLNNFLSK